LRRAQRFKKAEDFVNVTNTETMKRQQKNKSYAVSSLIANPEVLQRCLDLLEELKIRLKSDDLDHEWDMTILLQLYGKSRTECSQVDLLISYGVVVS